MIIGQQRTKEILQKAILENKIADSYCFSGPQGVGKEALAIEFAKTLNCSNPIRTDSSVNSCGKCESCRQIEKLIHPNLLLVFSLPTPKGSGSSTESSISKMSEEQIDEISSQIQMKAQNPYHSITFPNATQIKISAVREIKQNLSYSSQRPGRRCILIFRAEEMTTEAANAFLKTLEEPHENVTIILTTSRTDLILPTILSRCQKIHCDSINEDEIANWLITQKGIAASDAAIAAGFAQGSLSRAEEFIDEDFKSFRLEAIDILRTALKRKTYRSDLYSKIDELVRDKNKQKLEQFLTILLFWFRDAITIINTNSMENIINIDQGDSLLKFSNAYASKNLFEVITLIEKAHSRIRRNVNQYLLLLDMFVKIKELLL
jgi:DNA polymerase-3 subunit delta'